MAGDLRFRLPLARTLLNAIESVYLPAVGEKPIWIDGHSLTWMFGATVKIWLSISSCPRKQEL